MTPHIPLLCPPRTACEGALGDAPVLIRVPTLAAGPRRVARPRTRPHGGRRRLRREVRVAASALLFAMPMSWALLNFAPIGPRSAPAATSSAAMPELALAIDDEPRASITLEPSAIAYPSAPAFQAPVAIPAGYLLPDHDSEESVHAGD